MIRNTPKNSVVPAMKHDMAKRIAGPKFLEEPLGKRTPHKSERGGKLVWGMKHGPQTRSLTMKRDKHFTRGAMGAQESFTGKNVRKPAAGWEETQS